MKKGYLYYATILILIVLIGIIIFNDSKKKTTTPTSSNIKNTPTAKTENNNATTKRTVPNGQVGIVSHKYDGYGFIEVIVKNNTGKKVDLVKVIVESWDKSGNNLGTHEGYIHNLNTTDTYKVNVFCNSDMSRYELSLKYN